MVLLGLIGGVFLAAALIVRELQTMRERAALTAQVDELRRAADAQSTHLRRAREDIVVLRAVLEQKHLLDDADLQKCRERIIEAPRRAAQERQAMGKDLQAGSAHMVIDDGEFLH